MYKHHRRSESTRSRRPWAIFTVFFGLGSLGCLRQYSVLEDSSAGSSETTMVLTGTGELSSTGDESSCTGECPDPPLCGDGILVPPEICDDGNPSPGDGCEPDCALTPGWPCGDTACTAPEDPESCPQDCPPVVCEDGQCGVGEDAKKCPQDCVAMCGQGVCEPGEGPEQCPGDCTPGTCANNACDGEEDPSKCPEDCPSGICGNNLCEREIMEHDPMEQSFCDEDCDPQCGDGVLWGDTEACDDGNAVDDDECSNDCIKARFVFITDSTPSGDLKGIAGADAMCQGEAQGKLKGTFRAWLSDDPKNAPAVRFASADFNGWYLLPGDPKKMTPPAPVAHGWNGLTGKLSTAILRRATGVDVAEVYQVWTNTTPQGELFESALNANCNKWTSNDGGTYKGRVGQANKTDETWTGATDSGCAGGSRLYCFQVSP